MHAPVQVTLQVPALHSTDESGPVVIVHDAPPQLIMLAGPAVPVQVEVSLQLKLALSEKLPKSQLSLPLQTHEEPAQASLPHAASANERRNERQKIERVKLSMDISR